LDELLYPNMKETHAMKRPMPAPAERTRDYGMIREQSKNHHPVSCFNRRDKHAVYDSMKPVSPRTICMQEDIHHSVIAPKAQCEIPPCDHLSSTQDSSAKGLIEPRNVA
jgi:hypothetical protein